MLPVPERPALHMQELPTCPPDYMGMEQNLVLSG